MNNSERKIRILVVSNTAWDDANSFGSSYSNIFGGNDKYEIANIYCRPGSPRTKVCSRFFQITEKSIVENLFKKNKHIGAEIEYSSTDIIVTNSEAFNFGQRHRWRILYWGRNLIWGGKRWKSPSLDNFIDDFKPDIIFQPVYYSTYIGEIALYAKQRLDVPMIGYISDDNYTLKQYSWSLAFWLERLYIRRFVKKVIDACSILYTITPRQRVEYNEIFGNKCKVLTKGCLFSDTDKTYVLHYPIRLIYAGGLGNGRLQTLSLIAKAIDKFNDGKELAKLRVYSRMPLTEKQLKLLNIEGSSEFMGGVSPEEINRIQEETDIFVHVESFSKKERYSARLSFSTKITDYLQMGKCVLAVGWEQTGAIEMLKNNDAAFVITDEDSIEDNVKALLSDSNMIISIGSKGYHYAKKAFNICKMRNMVFSDIDSVIAQ